jgi:hypothetical protein
LEQWTRDIASHIESVDSAVKRLVGFAPASKTDVVVDDPMRSPMDRPGRISTSRRSTSGPLRPIRAQDIGEFNQWSEMVATHEFAHIAHLTRPSRNTFMRGLWTTLPVNLGPVAIRSPRWVIEGYATYVEGRVTRSGRPNGTWRAAFLRQWALEGQLPTYEQLNASSAL